MTLKRWVLGKVNPTADMRARGTARIAPSLREAAHLGRYAELVSAIRGELEQFVSNELRLHLAIAERDRFVLTSIEVECEQSEEQRELLRRFMREFKPEQIKQYLARDVIAGLRNAGAIDLTQFAGLNATREDAGDEDEEDPYAELVAQLQSQSPEQPPRPYTVRLLGRWSEQTSPLDLANSRRANTSPADVPHTPLAARSHAFEVADANGPRVVELSVVPGQRYSIGKDESFDIVLDGVYASRRHCEIWLERDRWWVADSRSTNGIRVEANGMAHRVATAGESAAPIPLAPGASLVLSAHGEADAAQYPRLQIAGAQTAFSASPPTLVTPIAPARRAHSPWSIAAHMASGARDVEVMLDALPFGVGRSRNRALVIDWAHADVSGRHIDIVALDETGADVLVHGDNGVVVDGTLHAAGAQFRWKPGEEMVLGRDDGRIPRCRLILSHEVR